LTGRRARDGRETESKPVRLANPISWVIALHLFGVIFWIGGLLMIASMLSRAPEEVGQARERFLVTAQSLFEINVNVGAGATIAFGILLVFLEPSVLRQGWFLVKLMLVAVLLFYHVRFFRRIRYLQDNPSATTHREFSVVHGAVSLLVFVILLLTILKPF
jgi:protoporphyrinogen IX oxidase